MEPPANTLNSETSLLETITQHLRSTPQPPELVLGIGDDAAATRNTEGITLHTADALVEGSHFTFSQASPHELGWKAIAVNQSDIAAMGGTPATALLTLGISPKCNTQWVDQFCRGIAEALAKNGGACIGGDTVASDTLFISVAMTGTAGRDAPIMTRAAARPGDLIGVTGTLGAAAGWLATHSSNLRQRHFMPEPRLQEGRMLAAMGVQCAMDISDGLILDLQRMADASAAHAVLRAHAVPVDPNLMQAASGPAQALDLALGGGEDYELLFACPPHIMEKIAARKDISATCIGEFAPRQAGAGAVEVLDAQGNPLQVQHRGWDPFREA